MTLKRKLELIDEYLGEGIIDPEWEEMILEYRRMLNGPQIVHEPTVSEFRRMAVQLGYEKI